MRRESRRQNAETPTAIRPRYRRPSGRETVAAVSTPTKGQREKKRKQKRSRQKQKAKYRTGREGGTLVYSPRLVPVIGPGPESLGRERKK